MVTDYNKPFLSIAEQIALLESRGMYVEDYAEIEYYFRNEGYYRMSSYWYPFRMLDKTGQRDDLFVKGASFTHVIQLYEFDKWLRSIVLSGLRGIEISVRVAVAHELGAKDIFAHENPSLLNPRFAQPANDRRQKGKYQIWLEKYRHLLLRKGQEDFIQTFIDKYGTKIPIWLAIEIWDFGMLTRFYDGMKYQDQQAVSKQYGVHDPKIFSSWLNAFNYVRNICAHHSRLWNRALIRQPRIPDKGVIPLLDHLTRQRNMASRTYTILAMCSYVLQQMQFRGLWLEPLRFLAEKFPSCPSLSLEMMGFPENWKTLELWQDK